MVGKLPDGFGRLAAEDGGFGVFLAAGGKRGGNQEGEGWADEGVHVWISLAGWEWRYFIVNHTGFRLVFHYR